MTQIVSLIAAVIFVIIMICGILFVPEHDGQFMDVALLVLLPAVGLCWCIANFIRRNQHE